MLYILENDIDFDEEILMDDFSRRQFKRQKRNERRRARNEDENAERVPWFYRYLNDHTLKNNTQYLRLRTFPNFL